MLGLQASTRRTADFVNEARSAGPARCRRRRQRRAPAAAADHHRGGRRRGGFAARPRRRAPSRPPSKRPAAEQVQPIHPAQAEGSARDAPISSISPISPATELRAILRAGEDQGATSHPAAAGDRLLEGKVIAMIFEQPSLRTARFLRRRHPRARRLADDGRRASEIELGERETIAGHRARALALCRRDHDPHPRPRRSGRDGQIRHRPGDQRPDQAPASCQVMADVMTFEERKARSRASASPGRATPTTS